MRLTLTDDETLELIELLYELEKTELADKIKKQAFKTVKTTKRNATKTATETKIKTTKNKIQKTVNMMRLESKKITAYTVAKESGVSYNSCVKYSYLYS